MNMNIHFPSIKQIERIDLTLTEGDLASLHSGTTLETEVNGVKITVRMAEDE